MHSHTKNCQADKDLLSVDFVVFRVGKDPLHSKMCFSNVCVPWNYYDLHYTCICAKFAT